VVTSQISANRASPVLFREDGRGFRQAVALSFAKRHQIPVIRFQRARPAVIDVIQPYFEASLRSSGSSSPLALPMVVRPDRVRPFLGQNWGEPKASRHMVAQGRPPYHRLLLHR